MSIQTLLVHLAPDPDCEHRLQVAVEMAKGLNAHLIALYVASPVQMPAGAEGRGASALFLEQAVETARKRSGALKQLVEDLTQKAGVSCDWVYGEADHLETLLHHVYYVDLTVVNQVSFDTLEDRVIFQLPEKLVMGAGGPVLVLPCNGDAMDLDNVGDVLIAWTPSREAIRAVRDSMMILKAAKSVKILCCHESPEETAEQMTTPLVDYLARHGITALPYIHPLSDHAGEEILEVAAYLDVNLIVMGAYGHTSLLDKLFGSASRHVIARSPVPVLMSH